MGNKIVGYIDAEHHGGHRMGWTSQAWDIHDAFELGIKMEDGTWWFEGDIGTHWGLVRFTLVYDEDTLQWTTLCDGALVRFSYQVRQFLSESRKIGSIHDK